MQHILTMHYESWIVTWLLFALGAMVSFVVQLKIGRFRLNIAEFVNYIDPKIWISRSTMIDGFMFLVDKIIDRLIGPLFRLITTMFALEISDIIEMTTRNHEIVPINVFYIIVYSIVIFLVVDFSAYASHYLLHRIPILWELHKVHHSAVEMTPITVKRAHPLGNMFENICNALLVSIPFGVIGAISHLNIINMLFLQGNATMLGSILILEDLKHTKFAISFGWIEYLICAPILHQIHHSCYPEHCDKNFGNKLSIWDWMFGTLYRPKFDEAVRWGLHDGSELKYNSLSGVYILPLHRCWLLLFPNESENVPINVS